MTSSTLPLNSVCPTWTGQLIPSAFAALNRGIDKERARFRGKPFVVVAQRHEFDFDGLTEYLELLEGFVDQPPAILYARQKAEGALSRELSEPSYGDYQWQLVEARQPYPFNLPCPESSTVNRVFSDSFKVANGSGYDSKYIGFEVLYVTSAEIISPELFSFLKAESEWVSFLISRGESEDGR
jgi:hypothetical protein